MAGLQTEYAFTLPKGYVDGEGTLHRQGTMRLATARDEIEPLRDPRVTGSEDPYLTILVISRVIKELGSLRHVSPQDVESLFAADLAFLQDLYGIINFGDPADVEVLQRAVVPAGAPTAAAAPGDASSASSQSPLSPASTIASSGSATVSRARGLIEEVSHSNGV